MVPFALPSAKHEVATVHCFSRNKFCFTGGLLEGADRYLIMSNRSG